MEGAARNGVVAKAASLHWLSHLFWGPPTHYFMPPSAAARHLGAVAPDALRALRVIAFGQSDLGATAKLLLETDRLEN